MDSTSTPNIQTPTESTNSPHFSLLRQPSPLKFHHQSPPPTPMDPPADDPSSLWDFSDLLDFSLDDHLLLPPFASPPNDNENSPPSPDPPPVSDRVRKRDPRLTCSNFLAGRVPCACPEMDAQLLEEEKLQPSKKRSRVSRAQSAIVKCQVPSCLADISELKGYHKRHRVCLRCANASAVVLHGDTKRYCQQCGKFHLLSDFDEGKRSCRRKLERHNNRRRRRKPALVDQEPTQNDGADCEDFGQMVEKETLVETDDGLVSNLNSTPTSINPNNSDSGPASGDTNVDGGKDDSKFSLSPSYCDDKSAYSSMCPTGRISFKLYDWNPAEFPRRLRHQIFQWLASMPVELEGYIRPGCTILTAFIAMPKFMWQKLLKDPELYVHEFVVVPGKMLSRKGRIRIYLNDLIFHVLSDGNSVMRFNMEMMTPKLHYVHPICFEAGKPIQLVACGSNLLQPNFRFLVSFAGKYLAHDYCVTFPCNESKGGSSHDHQLCKIFIPHSEPNVFGPAFIEVENASGVSNVIPVLIGDKEVCSEMEIILQRLTASHRTDSQCMIVASRQLSVLEFVVDVAWLLREPSFEYLQQIKSSTQIQRFNHLLNFLLHHESTAILTKVVENLKIIMDKMEITSNGITGSLDGDRLLLNKHMDHANSIICQKLKKRERLKLQTDDTEQERSCSPPNYCESEKPSISPSSSENVEIISNGKSGIVKSWASIERTDIVPLLDKEVVMNVNLARGRSSKSCNQMFPNKFLKSRSTMFVVVIVTVCFGVCAVILHPNKVSRLAVSIRRCLTDGLV